MAELTTHSRWVIVFCMRLSLRVLVLSSCNHALCMYVGRVIAMTSSGVVVPPLPQSSLWTSHVESISQTPSLSSSSHSLHQQQQQPVVQRCGLVLLSSVCAHQHAINVMHCCGDRVITASNDHTLKVGVNVSHETDITTPGPIQFLLLSFPFLSCSLDHYVSVDNSIQLNTVKKFSYRRGTSRCVVSVKILPIATQQCRNYLYDKS